MKINAAKITKWVLSILAILVSLTLLLWGCVIGFIATPEIVTPHIVNLLQSHTKSEVSIKSVDLSLFARFPNLTLRIDSLRIAQTKDSIPDLIFARQCRVAINPFELYRSKHLALNHISVRDAYIYMYTDSIHDPLKIFIQPEIDELQREDSIEMIDIGDYTLSVKKMVIDSLNITIDDRTKEFYTRIDNYNANVSMNVSSSRSDLDVVTGFSNLIVWRKGELLVKKTSMELRSKMEYNRDSMTIRFDKARLKINKIDLKARGELRRDSVRRGVQMDVRTSLNTPSLAEFLALVPSSIIDSKERITASGEVQLDMELKGLYSKRSFPTIETTLKVNDANAKYESRKLSLESVNCDAYTFVDLNNPTTSYVDVRSLHVNTSGIIDLNVSGRVDNIIESPAADLSIRSNINLDRFTELFPLNDAISCRGTNISNIKSAFKVADLQNRNFAEVVINGESTLHNIDINVDTSKLTQDTTSLAHLHMRAERGQILFGDNIRPDANSRTLRSQANFQDISYRTKMGEYVDIKDIELTIGASFDRTTSLVNGVGMRGIAKNSSVGIDSLVNATMESSDVTFIVKPKNDTLPTSIQAIINSQHIIAKEFNFNSSMELSTVDINLTMERLDDQMQTQAQTQTQSQAQPRKWNMESGVSFANLSMYSDILPIETTIKESTISMKNNTIFLNNAHATIGNSDIVATGSIQNIIRKMFIDQRTEVSGELSIKASTLDFGEIFEASNRSVLIATDDLLDEVSESKVRISESEVSKNEGDNNLSVSNFVAQNPNSTISTIESASKSTPKLTPQLAYEPADSLARRSAATEASSMFIVPRQLNFDFDLNVDKGIFWDTSIENIEGRATLKNGVLSLNHISLNAIDAEVVGSLVYRNIDRVSSNIAADVKLEHVDINRIGELLPSIGSMMPMLESFEGVVDFDIKAYANIDQESAVDISTLYSAMRFKGRDLVLMDSETFADLSKTLMFKNKERNLIDSVEIFALVAESKVDVLPFPISIDRYSAIVGGSQVVDPNTFNVDYNYQISIIKSPLPFKAGVDVTGDLENFKYKVTKAKLKKSDFDEQRKIYEEYGANIEASESALVQEIEARRNEMRARRQEQRLAQQKAEEEIENEKEEEAQTETGSEPEPELEPEPETDPEPETEEDANLTTETINETPNTSPPPIINSK